MGYDAPFAGLTILDLSQGIAGPYCGMLLAQQGADVIKVVDGNSGEIIRQMPTDELLGFMRNLTNMLGNFVDEMV